MKKSPPIALLAGEGSMPLKVIQGIKEEGHKVLLLAIIGSTPKELEKEADTTVWLHITQLGKAVRTCMLHGAKELVMAGRIQHKNIFSISLLKLDWTALLFWLKLKDNRADTILSGIGSIFKKAGITLLSSIRFLKPYIAKEGILTEKKPSSSVWKDIEFGVKIAKELGRLDIGQTVVVKNLSIVAVEAMEGTDDCIERAGKMAGHSTVVVKMAKPGQDMRFDVPVVGVNTIEKLAKIKAVALAIEAEATLIIDKELIACANKNGIVIVALKKEQIDEIINTQSLHLR